MNKNISISIFCLFLINYAQCQVITAYTQRANPQDRARQVEVTIHKGGTWSSPVFKNSEDSSYALGIKDFPLYLIPMSQPNFYAFFYDGTYSVTKAYTYYDMYDLDEIIPTFKSNLETEEEVIAKASAGDPDGIYELATLKLGMRLISSNYKYLKMEKDSIEGFALFKKFLELASESPSINKWRVKTAILTFANSAYRSNNITELEQWVDLLREYDIAKGEILFYDAFLWDNFTGHPTFRYEYVIEKYLEAAKFQVYDAYYEWVINLYHPDKLNPETGMRYSYISDASREQALKMVLAFSAFFQFKIDEEPRKWHIQYLMAMQYYHGDGITKNLNQAAYWMNKAKKNGHQKAAERWEEFKLAKHLKD